MSTKNSPADAIDTKTLSDQLREGVSVEDRSSLFRSYKRTFLGSDAVKFLLAHNHAASESEAIALGNLLIEHKLIRNAVNPNCDFENNNQYYRFAADEKSHGHVAASSNSDTDGAGTSSNAFWQRYAESVFGKNNQGADSSLNAEGSLLSDLPWEDKSGYAHLDDITVNIPPTDPSNIALLSNVHPQPWMDPTPEPMYNLVVIGGGAGGLVSSIGSAGVGAKVAIVEGHLLGGDCTNFGCVPSKALIKSAHVIHQARNGRGFGLDISGGPDVISADFARVMQRMREIRAKISDFEAATRLSSLGIDVFIGHGKFDSPSSLIVNGKKLNFRKCIICSGGKAFVPNLPGLNTVPYLTNESLFNLTTLPKHLVVIGGGPIGLEMAQSFRRYGCEVTVLVRGHKLLDKEDYDAARVVETKLRKEGVTIVTQVTNQSFEKVSENGIKCSFDCPESGTNATTALDSIHITNDHSGNSQKVSPERSDISTTAAKTKQCAIECDQVLIATGRRPTVLGFGLDVAGVACNEKDGILVDDSMKTSNPLIYAAGDCCSRFQFTHAADAMARIAVMNALFYGKLKFSKLIMPWCTFTDPEIAHVGLYPHDMEARGLAYDTYEKEFDDVDRAVCEGETDGFVKIHVKKGTDEILGCTIVGEGAGNMISEVTTLMHANIGLSRLASVIHPYPTRADAIRQIGDQYNQQNITPFTRRILKGILSFSL